MKETDIKTRHGLILQGIVGLAFTSAGYKFRENWQYDPDNERPDFTIPDIDKPKFMVEVHQTEARNSFQMKVLRSFSAVCEAKCFFGGSIISVNVLFGDPATEVPESNLKALCGFFDVNIIPRNTSCSQESIRIERDSLKLAEDEEYDVAKAVAELKRTRAKDIAALGTLLKQSLATASVAPVLTQLWKFEKQRIDSLGPVPSIYGNTHFKTALLRSLFLSDSHFAALLKQEDPNKLPEAAKQQLRLLELVEERPSIRGPSLVLDPILADFVVNPAAGQLRKYCEVKIDSEQSMRWFFEDIRDEGRRLEMATRFVAEARKGELSLAVAISSLLANPSSFSINHERDWLADFLPLVTEVSQNEFNRRMVQSGRDPENYQYPFNHIVGRFERLINNPAHFDEYSKHAVDIYVEICREKRIDPKLIGVSANDLANRLLELRLDGAIKLQRFNPHNEIVRSIANRLDLSVDFIHAPSLLYDLSGGDGRLGKYDVIQLSVGQKQCIVKTLYVGEGYGSDHKADEWSARRRSLGYRIQNNSIIADRNVAHILVVDGVWSAKSIKKAHVAGWDHVCQIPQLEAIIKACFGL